MFLSTVTNSLDAKGRVSVPADFRSVVANSSFDGIICLLYTSPSPRDRQKSRMPSSA